MSRQEKVTKGNNSKNIDARVMNLVLQCMTFALIPVYPCMKFHLNSISRTGVIVRTRKNTKGKNSENIDARVTDFAHDT